MLDRLDVRKAGPRLVNSAADDDQENETGDREADRPIQSSRSFGDGVQLALTRFDRFGGAWADDQRGEPGVISCLIRNASEGCSGESNSRTDFRRGSSLMFAFGMDEANEVVGTGIDPEFGAVLGAGPRRPRENGSGAVLRP